MSIRIMSRIWEDGPDQQSELLVLLALADWANDDGDCWPSMAGIARKARIEERSARRIVRRLEESGWLSVGVNGGRNGCNNYRINPDPKSPGLKVPRTEKTLNPDPRVRPPRTPRSPEQSITIKEPSDISKTREAAALLEAWAGPEAVASFIAYRRKSKGKALTLTASKRLAENLKAIFQAGGNPDDALGMAEERGWLTIEPDWYFNAKGKHHGNRHSAPDNPTLRAIARAAGAFEASPVDWPAGRGLT
jgi:hypothetical protein